jgi:ankyrin repeat protein
MRFLVRRIDLLIVLVSVWLFSEIPCPAGMGTAADVQHTLFATHNGCNGAQYSAVSADGMVVIAQLLRQVGEEEYRIARFLSASRNGDLDGVRKFLDEGLDVNSKNSSGDTALMQAAAQGRREVVELLLARGVDVQVKNKARQNAVSIAVMNKQGEIALLLMNKGKVKPSELLLAALRHADVKLARTLIAKAPTPIDSFYLLAASESGNVEAVRLVLDKGADPNFENGVPLMRAIQHAPLEVMQLLLEKGARAETEPKGYNNHTPLSWACYRLRPDAANLLLQKGANINVKAEKEGRTPLMYALEGCKTEPGWELIKLLVNAKADVNAKDANGRTALHYACSDGSLEAVTLLLDNGADIEAKDTDGRTPLIEAALLGRVQVARLLIARGANVNAKSEKGWTPLAAAKKKGFAELESLLRSRGAKQQRR